MGTASQRLARCLERELPVAYLLVLPVMAVGSVRVAGLYVIPADWMFPLLALAVVWRGVRWAAPDRLDLLLLAYPLAVALAALRAGQASGAGAVAVAVYLAALAWIVMRACDAPAGRRRLATAWVVAAALAAALALAASVASAVGVAGPGNPLLAGHGSLPAAPWARPRALFFGVNTLASFLVVGAALAWHRWRRGSRGDGWALCVIVAACLATLSPGIGALLATLALLAGFDAPCGSRRRTAAWLLAGLASLATLAVSAVDPTALLGGEIEPSVRFRTWAAAVEVAARHPLLGAGPSDPGIVVGFRAPDGALQRLVDAHSLPLDVLARTGIVGLLLLGTLVGGSVVRSLRRASAQDGLGVTLTAAVVGAWGVQGLTGSFQETRHLWLLLGLLLAASRGATESGPRDEGADVSRPAAPTTPPG